MVTIEDITEKEEKAKGKIREAISLIKKHLPNLKVGSIGNAIVVSEEKEPYNSILMFQLKKHINKVEINLHSKNYFSAVENFANEYEELFIGEKVHIETDYSK
mgnify:CR=1 FL=1